MATRVCKALSFFFFFCTACLQVRAQNLTGIWRGYFITDGAEKYKYEVQIGQSPTKRLTGVTYSYLDTRFYGKATFTGNYNKGGNNALVQETRTVEVRMSGASIACIMKCNLVYTKSGNEEFLEGSYTSTYEKGDTLMGIRRGGGCGGGKVFLQKVPTSDFYVESFLRTNPKVDKPNTAAVKKALPKPAPKTTASKPPAKPAITATKKPAVKNGPVVSQSKPDTVKRVTNIPTVAKAPEKTLEKPALKIPAITRERSNELLQTLTVQHRDVEVKLYDNGEIDDDTISVYLDNKLVLANKRLSAAPLSLSINMVNDGEEHVLVMVAENMGRIPPNTSLMIVYDGDKRYEVRVTSTEQKNAMVRFRFKSGT